MSYNGTTAASSVTNPPRLIAGPMYSREGSSRLVGSVHNGAGGALWSYVSTDTVAAVIASSYFSDGYKLGMRPGDFIMGVQHTTDGATLVNYFGAVTVVDSTAGGATVQIGGVATT